MIAAHQSITTGWVRTRRMLVRPAVIASVRRSRIIGMLTTLTAKMMVANTLPSAIHARMKSMLRGSTRLLSVSEKSGMLPLNESAKTTSEARAHSISSTSSMTPKIASVSSLRRHAIAASMRRGRWPRSSRSLTK